MSIKKFGARDINLISPTGTPNITSPGELNLNASTVAISTDLSVGGQVSSDLDIVGVTTFQDTAVFNGSVGIGTSTPQGALEVVGNVNITGVLSATNFDLPDLNITDDDKNVFIGEDTGSNYDASTESACYNVAIGYNAAECLTTGDNNVFLGRYAGHDNCSGANNIFMGCGSGFSNTCGNHNFFGGYQSGRNATRALCSIHIGYHAGYNSCGDGNIFLGTCSGYNTRGNGSSCGTGNVFLGLETGQANQNGSYNILVGEEAGRCNTGCNNTVMGFLAGCRNTGDSNIIIGRQAGRNKVAGNNNIFLGDAAGNNVTSGANNVLIGREVNPPSLIGSNQLEVGVGTNRWISGDSSYNVGIGSTLPTTKLDVDGDQNVSGQLTLGSPTNISLFADGSSEFSGQLNVGDYKNANNSSGGVVLFTVGSVKANRPSSQSNSSLFVGAMDGNVTSLIKTSGEAYFTGKVGINTDVVDATAALNVDGHVYPSVDNAHDLGSLSRRWRNIYTTDLKLSNEGKTNDVDGTWGKYTIQEGEEELYLINHRNGKKYKFMLQEVN